MSDNPDELAARLLELAECEVPPADERFEAGIRQVVRWEQRRRRTQRRWLVTVGCLTALCAALAVALALPVWARHLPLPVGSELRRLDAQASGLQAQLAAQAAFQAQLRHQLAARAVPTKRVRPVARHRTVAPPRAAAPAPLAWSHAWAWAGTRAAPSVGATSPTGASQLGSASSSPSPSPTATPTPTSSPTSP